MLMIERTFNYYEEVLDFLKSNPQHKGSFEYKNHKWILKAVTFDTVNVEEFNILTDTQYDDLLKFVEQATVYVYQANDAITSMMVTHGLDELTHEKLIEEAFSLSERLKRIK